MREYTPVIIVALPICLGLLDVLLCWAGGNDATFSKVMLDIRTGRPLVALSTAYSFGVLLGHFFFPAYTDTAPPLYEMIARMWVVLSPTIYAMIIIGHGNGLAASHTRTLEAGGHLLFAVYMTVAVVLGGVFGWAALPQHITPPK